MADLHTMARETLYRLCPTHAEAVQVAADLTAAGLDPAEIALIDNEEDARLPQGVSAEHAQDPAGVGASVGATIGAGLGVLACIGAITLPLMTPLVQAGWFAPCAALAMAGALCGALVGLVVRRATPAHLRAIAGGLQRGEILVLVRVDEAAIGAVQAILARPYASPSPALGNPPGAEDPAAIDPHDTIERVEQRIHYEAVHAGLDNPQQG